jgi:hypothetical protein
MERSTPHEAAPRTASLDFALAGLPNGEAMTRAATSLMKESMDFVSERLRADSRLLEQACNCGNLADLAALQQRWMAEAFRAYSEATTRMFTQAFAAAPPPEAQEAAREPATRPSRTVRAAEPAAAA